MPQLIDKGGKKMKTYDATKSLKQMFHRPNMAPFFSILFIIFFLLFVAMPVWGTIYSYIPCEIQSAKNAHYEPIMGGKLVTITIDRNGSIWSNWDKIEDISKLPLIIEDTFDRNCISNTRKILLKVDKRISFGKVQEVLRAVRKMDINVVGLITNEYATLCHFFKPVKK
jgi:biopolymer transport protein ExbD